MGTQKYTDIYFVGPRAHSRTTFLSRWRLGQRADKLDAHVPATECEQLSNNAMGAAHDKVLRSKSIGSSADDLLRNFRGVLDGTFLSWPRSRLERVYGRQVLGLSLTRNALVVAKH